MLANSKHVRRTYNRPTLPQSTDDGKPTSRSWRRRWKHLLAGGCFAVTLLGGLANVQSQEADNGVAVVRFSDVAQDNQVAGPVAESVLAAEPVWQQVPDEVDAQAKDKKAIADLNKKAAGAYKGVFFDNNFSYLDNPLYSGELLGERFKERCLPGGGTYDIGGQYRFRGHAERNMRGLGLTGVDDQFLLHRTRIYGDFQFTPRFRIYAEMLDAESNEENFNPRPIEVNRTEMQNLFFDVKFYSGARGDLTARIGRQELLYGAQRDISPLDWANTRRTFEGGKIMFKNKAKDLSIDGFWTNPVRVDDHSFDSPDRDQEFMGIYTSYTGRKDQTIDTYFLRYLNGRGSNNFKVNTFGSRWQGSKCGTLWDMEAAYQSGQNTNGSDHSAGMATFGVGRKLAERSWQPTVWLYYDYASGDADTGAGNGFNHNFPLAHKYLGFMDLYGRRNIEDVNLQLTMQPTKRLKFLAWYHYMFLATQSDTPYSVVMTPFNAGNAPGSTDLGNEIDFVLSYKGSARRQVALGYSHFFAGKYYDTTPGVPYSDDADFFWTQFTVNF